MLLQYLVVHTNSCMCWSVVCAGRSRRTGLWVIWSAMDKSFDLVRGCCTSRAAPSLPWAELDIS